MKKAIKVIIIAIVLILPVGLILLPLAWVMGCWGLGPGFLQVFIEERGRAVAVDRSGNIYVVGEFSGTADFDPGPAVDRHKSNGGSDVFLSKFDSMGNFLWACTWGGSGDSDYISDVAIDSGGSVYVTGDFVNTQELYGHLLVTRGVDFDPGPGLDVHTAIDYSDMYLSKFDSSGDFLWARTWGGVDSNALKSTLAVDNSDNILVTGYFQGTIDFDPGPKVDQHTGQGDLFLSKFDSTGSFLSVRTGEDNRRCSCVYADDGIGNVYVTGSFGNTIDLNPGPSIDEHTSNGEYDAYLLKCHSPGSFLFDSTESFLWARSWGGPSFDFIYGVAVDDGGGVYVTGFFSDWCDFDPGSAVDRHKSSGERDIFLSKFDSDGNFIWARTWGSRADWESGYGVAVDGSGYILVTGQFSRVVDFDPGPGVDSHRATGYNDVFLSKFDSNGNFIWARTWGGVNLTAPF